MEPDFSFPYDSVVPIHGYTMLRPGSSRVSVGLRNISCQKITIQAKSVIAKVTAANVIPHSLAPNINQEQLKENLEQRDSKTNNKVKIPPSTPEKEKLLLSKIDLSGTKNWDLEHIKQARDLFKDFAHTFTLESLDMGHTSVVKHKIKLDNYTPFKERYHRIPPNLFDEVRSHLKEMLEVGAIRHSSSPWASAVVLVRWIFMILHWFKMFEY